MDTRVNQGKVATIVGALVDACTNDPEKLAGLLYVLQEEGPGTGLGYVVTQAIERIEAKLELVNSVL